MGPPSSVGGFHVSVTTLSPGSAFTSTGTCRSGYQRHADSDGFAVLPVGNRSRAKRPQLNAIGALGGQASDDNRPQTRGDVVMVRWSASRLWPASIDSPLSLTSLDVGATQVSVTSSAAVCVATTLVGSDGSCAAACPAPSANTIPASAIHLSALQLPLAKIAPVRMSQSPL